MASSEILEMVGTAMRASISEALNIFRPVGMSNASWRNGATITIPKNPMTTEGNDASSSMIGFKISLTL